MKRELIAVFIIAALLMLALENIRQIENKTETLTNGIESAEKLYLSGDRQGAAAGIEDSLNTWLNWDFYSHIMLRHSEIDVITDAYYTLLSELQSEDTVTQASFERLDEQLRSILIKERVTLGSIL